MPPVFAASSSAAEFSNASGQIASATDQQPPRCGATAADAMKQARLSLRSNDAGSERAALACLIEAVSALNAKTPAATRVDGDSVLSVPAYSGPIK